MSSAQLSALAGIAMVIGSVCGPATAGITSNALIGNALTSIALSFNALANNALTSNAIVSNAITSNALSINALGAAGSALDDLNGVAIEAVTLPTQPAR